MIINNTYQLVFVHIPKCAGTSVRNILQPYDETHGAFTRRIDDHPSLGHIDYVHIPLFVLKDHFRDQYEKVVKYQSYAIIRDPYARFPSSLSQHLIMSGKSQIKNLKTQNIKKEISNTIKVLKNFQADKSYLPSQYIHFQRQVDFICLDGQRLINHVYDISHLSTMLVEIGKRLGVSLNNIQAYPDTKTNKTFVYRNRIIRLASEITRPILKPLIPSIIREKISQYLLDLLYVPRQKGLQDIFDSQYIKDFISDYYAMDILLHKQICRHVTK